MQKVRILGIILFLLGLWVFLAPFIGPVMHMNFSPPPMQSGISHMGGMNMNMNMNMNVIVVNPAIVAFVFFPGAILMFIGVYLAFSGNTSPSS